MGGEKMLRGSTGLCAAAFASIGMVGLFHTIMAAALTEMGSSFGMGTLQLGALGAAYWSGFTVGVSAAGALSDFCPRSNVLAGACILTAAGALRLGTGSAAWFNLVLTTCLGGGTGAIVSSSSALMMELRSGKEGKVMNAHHLFYSLGAIAGPVVMGHVLGVGRKWQGVYRLAGALSLCLAVPMLLARARRPQPGGLRGIRTVVRALGDPGIWLLAGLTVLGIGAQNGTIYWIVSFLHESRGMPVFRASAGLALVSAGMGAGRLALVWLAGRIEGTTLLVVLFVCVNLSLSMLLFCDGSFDLVFCLLLGCGFSGLFPILLAMGGVKFPSLSGTVVGIISTAAGAGSAMVPWITSVVMERRGPVFGLGLNNLMALSGLCLAFFIHRTPSFKLPAPGSAEDRGNPCGG